MNTREATREYRIAQWAQVLQERKAEGKTIKEFCQSRGITLDSYYYWQRIVRAAVCEQLAVSETKSIEHRAVDFAKVLVTESSMFPASANAEPIRIEYGDVKISIGDAYAPDKLAIFVRELARP